MHRVGHKMGIFNDLPLLKKVKLGAKRPVQHQHLYADNKSRQLLGQGKRGGGCLRASRWGFVHILLVYWTTASCSVVFFTAYETCKKRLLLVWRLECVFNCKVVKQCNTSVQFLWSLTGCIFLVCQFESFSSMYFASCSAWRIDEVT